MATLMQEIKMEKLIQEIVDDKVGKERLVEMLRALYGVISHVTPGIISFTEDDRTALIEMGLLAAGPDGDLFLTSKGRHIVQQYLLK